MRKTILLISLWSFILLWCTCKVEPVANMLNCKTAVDQLHNATFDGKLYVCSTVEPLMEQVEGKVNTFVINDSLNIDLSTFDKLPDTVHVFKLDCVLEDEIPDVRIEDNIGVPGRYNVNLQRLNFTIKYICETTTYYEGFLEE